MPKIKEPRINQVTELRRMPAVECDHGVKMVEDCFKCTCLEAQQAIADLNHEDARQALYQLEIQTGFEVLSECGCCGCEHPIWFYGDCRYDRFRF